MKYFLLICLCLTGQIGFTQSWKRFNDIPRIDIIDLKTDGNMMYAPSFSNKIYISADHGASWRVSTVGPLTVKVTALTLFRNKLYAGTDANGIFMSSDTGRNWVSSGAGLLTISSIVEWRNGLYASTLGTGIYKLNEATNQWMALNNGIPSYSVNVFAMINANDTLIAAAGANGTYYRYDAPTGQWIEIYYFSRIRAGLQISDIIYEAGTFLSIASAQFILRSDNAGVNWYFDTVNLKRGPTLNTKVATGANKYYAVISDALNGGSWIQYKDKLPGAGRAWTTMEDFIATGYTYAIREFSDNLYLCRTDGLYYQDKVTAVNDPVTNDPIINDEVSIYPNPVINGKVNIISKSKISDIKIISLSGAIVYHSQSQQREYNLPQLPAGMYIVYITIGKKIWTVKIIQK